LIDVNHTDGRWSTNGKTETIAATRTGARLLYIDHGGVTQFVGTSDMERVVHGDVLQEGILGGSFVLIRLRSAIKKLLRTMLDVCPVKRRYNFCVSRSTRSLRCSALTTRS